jgi:hypothetical protein
LRNPVFLLASMLAATACPSPSPLVCSDDPKGWCGPGKYCFDDGRLSGCKPIPTDRSLCGPEKWPGECGQSVSADAGLGQDRRTDSAGDVLEPSPVVDGPIDIEGVTGERVDASNVLSEDADRQPDVQADLVPSDSGCVNECLMGESRCHLGSSQACGLVSTGCTAWGNPQACPSPQTCASDKKSCECPIQNACASESAKRCSSGGLQTCEREGACLRWGTPASCEFGCDSSMNSCRRCRDNCPVVGRTSCGSTGVRECVVQPNGCTDWGPERACPSECRESDSGASCCGDGAVTGNERCDQGSSRRTELGDCNPECSGFYEKKFLRHTGLDFYPGNLGGPIGADQICRSKFGAGYKALIVGGGRRATETALRGDGQTDWVLRKFTHYFNEQNALVWRTDSTALLGVQEGQRVNLFADVFGFSNQTYPWGGYDTNWMTIKDNPASFVGTCQGWTTSSQNAWGNFPLTDLRSGASEPCSTSQPLLCVEQ